MSAVQGLLALAMLSLMVGKTSAVNETELLNTILSWPSSHHSQSLYVSCLPDIKDSEAYKIQHPNCSRLAARYRAIDPNATLQRNRCWSLFGRPMNVTLHWDGDPSRAASSLLAVLLRHVMGFQRVHLAPKRTIVPQFYQSDELVISLATVLEHEHQATKIPDQMIASGVSYIPVRRRLHSWLTEAARSISSCQYTNWTLYSDINQVSYCHFVDDLYEFFRDSGRDLVMDEMTVICVGDDCKPTMQRLQQRAKADGIPAGAVFLNRSDFYRERIEGERYSRLFLDFDIWNTEPGVSFVKPPPCVPYSDDCQSELDPSIGMLVVDRRIKEYYDDFMQLVQNFKPSIESLRAILEQEANGVNLEEAACGWIESRKSYFSDMFQRDNLDFMKPDDSKNIHAQKTYVAIYLCYTDDKSYDQTLKSIGKKIFMEKDALNISIAKYYVNCSDPEHMASRIDELMQGQYGPNVLGVVSLTVEGATAASRVAAAHHVPLLLVATVVDQGARGASTWLAAGRLRHVTRALHNFVSELGWTHVAVLSQPTTFAQHYFAELQDQAKFFLRNFEIPLDLTEQLAEVTLQDLRATKARVVVVNTNSDAAALILCTAVKLNMSYTDGYIWVLREPLTTPGSSTIHFTVSLSNQVCAIGNRRFEGPHDDALANALITLKRGFNNIFQRHPYMLNYLHNDQVIRALDDSLTETPVTGIYGEQLHYKERAIEEVYVYVDKWGGSLCRPQRLATWRVNATSGAVRDKNSSQPTLDLDFNVTHVPDVNSSDSGVRPDADGVKQYNITITNTPGNTTNTTLIVRQWTQSITKIETSKSDLFESDIMKFFKFN